MNQSESARRQNLSVLWFLNEKWFSILQYSFIIGALYYFKESTGNIFIYLIYWISWFVFYWWFLELGELVAIRIETLKKFSSWTSRIIAMGLVIIMYSIITEVAKSIAPLQ